MTENECPACVLDHLGGAHLAPRPEDPYRDGPARPARWCETCSHPSMTVAGTALCASHGVAEYARHLDAVDRAEFAAHLPLAPFGQIS